MQTFTFFVLAIVAGSALASLDEDECKKELQTCHDSTYHKMANLLSKGVKDQKNVEKRLKNVCKLYGEGIQCLDSLTSECDMTGDVKTLHDTLKKNLTAISSVCSKDGTLTKCGGMMIACGIVYEEAQHYLKKKDVDDFCFDSLVYDKCVKNTKDSHSCSTDSLPKMVALEFELGAEGLNVGCEEGCVKHLNTCLPNQKDPDCKALKHVASCLKKLNSEEKCDKKKTRKALEEAFNFRAAKLEEKNCPDGASSVSVSGAVLLLTVVATFLGRQL